VPTTSKEIKWRHDFEGALADAAREKLSVLLDFSAAPM
jgi:hypothetical protein